MSKHVNMTGHYKIAGRERQGEGILQSSQKGAFAQQRQETRLDAIESRSGPPPWETTPPNFEIAAKPKSRAKKGAARKGVATKRAKTSKGGKRAGTRAAAPSRKAAPKRKAARTGSRSRRSRVAN